MVAAMLKSHNDAMIKRGIFDGFEERGGGGGEGVVYTRLQNQIRSDEGKPVSNSVHVCLFEESVLEGGRC